MERALKANKAKGLTVVGIGIQDSEANIKKFASETGMSWPIGMDEGEKAAKAYAITFGAGVVMVDSLGIVRAWHGTAFNSETFEKELAIIMAPAR